MSGRPFAISEFAKTGHACWKCKQALGQNEDTNVFIWGDRDLETKFGVTCVPNAIGVWEGEEVKPKQIEGCVTLGNTSYDRRFRVYCRSCIYKMLDTLETLEPEKAELQNKLASLFDMVAVLGGVIVISNLLAVALWLM